MKERTLAMLLGFATLTSTGDAQQVASRPVSTEQSFSKNSSEQQRENYNHQFKTFEDITRLTQELQSRPTAWGYVRLGDLCWENQDKLADPFDLLQKSSEQALKLESNNWGAFVNLANAFMLKKDFQKAEVHYKRAYESAPDEIITNHMIGWFMCKMSRYQEAVPFLRMAASAGDSKSEKWLSYASRQINK